MAATFVYPSIVIVPFVVSRIEFPLTHTYYSFYIIIQYISNYQSYFWHGNRDANKKGKNSHSAVHRAKLQKSSS